MNITEEKLRLYLTLTEQQIALITHVDVQPFYGFCSILDHSDSGTHKRCMVLTGAEAVQYGLEPKSSIAQEVELEPLSLVLTLPDNRESRGTAHFVLECTTKEGLQRLVTSVYIPKNKLYSGEGLHQLKRELVSLLNSKEQKVNFFDYLLLLSSVGVVAMTSTKELTYQTK